MPLAVAKVSDLSETLNALIVYRSGREGPEVQWREVLAQFLMFSAPIFIFFSQRFSALPHCWGQIWMSAFHLFLLNLTGAFTLCKRKHLSGKDWLCWSPKRWIKPGASNAHRGTWKTPVLKGMWHLVIWTLFYQESKMSFWLYDSLWGETRKWVYMSPELLWVHKCPNLRYNSIS